LTDGPAILDGKDSNSVAISTVLMKHFFHKWVNVRENVYRLGIYRPIYWLRRLPLPKQPWIAMRPDFPWKSIGNKSHSEGDLLPTLLENLYQENGRKINLYKQGVFWTADEQSALILSRHKPLKISARFVKTVNQN
jgi:hypothetical protein